MDSAAWALLCIILAILARRRRVALAIAATLGVFTVFDAVQHDGHWYDETVPTVRGYRVGTDVGQRDVGREHACDSRAPHVVTPRCRTTAEMA